MRKHSKKALQKWLDIIEKITTILAALFNIFYIIYKILKG